MSDLRTAVEVLLWASVASSLILVVVVGFWIAAVRSRPHVAEAAQPGVRLAVGPELFVGAALTRPSDEVRANAIASARQVSRLLEDRTTRSWHEIDGVAHGHSGQLTTREPWNRALIAGLDALDGSTPWVRATSLGTWKFRPGGTPWQGGHGAKPPILDVHGPGEKWIIFVHLGDDERSILHDAAEAGPGMFVGFEIDLEDESNSTAGEPSDGSHGSPGRGRRSPSF